MAADAERALEEALARERALKEEVARLRGPGPLENAWREVEAEEEMLSNSMRKRMDELEREKLIISRSLDAENEAIANRLSRDGDGLRAQLVEWGATLRAFDAAQRPHAGPEALALLDALQAATEPLAVGANHPHANHALENLRLESGRSR